MSEQNDPEHISARNGYTVGCGILSWQSDETIENTLGAHREAGLFGLFDHVLLHFQEIRESDAERAERFGLPYVGSEHNRHIGGGFYKLIKELTCDYLFLLEDDLVLNADAQRLTSVLREGIEQIRRDQIDILWCRRDDVIKSGYTRFHGIDEFDRESNVVGEEFFVRSSALGRLIKRWRNPRRSRRAKGKAVWIEKHPESRFPDTIRRIDGGDATLYVLTGEATRWSNPAILASRELLLRIYDYVSRMNPGFEEYGYSLEFLMDTKHRQWWLSQGFRIATTKELIFRHDRRGEGGKMNFDPEVAAAEKRQQKELRNKRQ
jgi:hypothetical protein